MRNTLEYADCEVIKPDFLSPVPQANLSSQTRDAMHSHCRPVVPGALHGSLERASKSIFLSIETLLNLAS